MFPNFKKLPYHVDIRNTPTSCSPDWEYISLLIPLNVPLRTDTPFQNFRSVFPVLSLSPLSSGNDNQYVRIKWPKWAKLHLLCVFFPDIKRK